MRAAVTTACLALVLASATGALAGARIYSVLPHATTDYSGEDAGTLIVSIETEDSTRLGFVVERDDGHYVSVRDVSPSYQTRAHDFAEVVDYVDAWGEADPTGDSEKRITYWGKLEVLKLPPGDYHLTQIFCQFELRVSTHFVVSDQDFTITSGRATYLGEVRTLPGTWAPKAGPIPLGAVYNAPIELDFIDQSARDLGIAKQKGIDVTNVDNAAS